MCFAKKAVITRDNRFTAYKNNGELTVVITFWLSLNYMAEKNKHPTDRASALLSLVREQDHTQEWWGGGTSQ